MEKEKEFNDDYSTKKALSDYISTNLDQLKEARAPYETEWLEACQLFKHRLTYSTGANSHIKSVEAVPLSGTFHVECLDTTIAGFASQLLSPAIRWFRLHAMNKSYAIDDVVPYSKDWTEQVENIMAHLYDNSPSRFYSNTLLALQDSFVMGNSYEAVIDDVANKQVVFDCYNPWECYVRHDSNMIVNTFYREFTLTAVQAKQKWGDAIPEYVQEQITRGAGREFITFVNAICPSDEIVDEYGEKIKTTSKPYASLYYCNAGKEAEVFYISGYDTFPIANHRWKIEGNNDYGTSPILKHIETFKKYLKDEKTQSVQAQKLADPQIVAPSSLVGKISNRPGAKLFYNSATEGKPEYLQMRTDLSATQSIIEQDKQSIMRLMYTDLFKVLMMQDRERTAYEVQQLKGEGMALLSGAVGNIQVEKLVPVVKRTFIILKKSGVLPIMPEELKVAYEEGRITIDLDGPLAQTMKKYTKVNGLVNGIQGLQAIMQLSPTSLVNIDMDGYARQLGSALGIPENLIREKHEVDKIHSEEAKQLQKQQALQQQQQSADAMNKMGVTAEDLVQGQGA